jgi:hypothetical protein
MTDDDSGDSLWDTSFNGIGYALQVEMLDEVTRAAWQDAEELKNAAAKRPPGGRGVPSREQRTSPEEKPMDDLDSEWQRKGATLSDKTARKEFGLTQDEIVQAIRAGKLQYRRNSIHGNPFLRLLRREVEALVKKKHGDHYLKAWQAKTELAHINRKLRQLKTRIATLEERKSKLMGDLGR